MALNFARWRQGLLLGGGIVIAILVVQHLYASNADAELMKDCPAVLHAYQTGSWDSSKFLDKTERELTTTYCVNHGAFSQAEIDANGLDAFQNASKEQ